jgi:cysteine-S-conjugate beta-lyase
MIHVTELAGKYAVTDGGCFGIGGDGWLQINIRCPRSVLKEALKKMGKAFG